MRSITVMKGLGLTLGFAIGLTSSMLMTDPTGESYALSDNLPEVEVEPVSVEVSTAPITETDNPLDVPNIEAIPSSSNITLLVNKENPIPDLDYVPSDLISLSEVGVNDASGHGTLRLEAARQFKIMQDEALASGHFISVSSAYRSYSEQETLYASYLSSDQNANSYSAMPGYSEHQLGLAVDVMTNESTCSNSILCFEDTQAFSWMSGNSWKYGFILRYPSGQEDITGYDYEAWHYRYVGLEEAENYKNSGYETYDEYKAN